jgi:NAD(P)H-hydrate epimerase
MVGAPVLCGGAALRSGVGLVTMAFPESAYVPVASKLTEALMMPLPETAEGTVSKSAVDKILASLDKYSAVVIGCGLGVNEDTKAVLKAVLSNSKVPVIVDADGINIIAQDISMLQSASCDVILTPHPGEMSRLCGTRIELIETNRVGTAREFASNYNVYLVLKGANTIVAQPDTKKAYVNSSGNSGLAKGGSGDVLSGLMGGFIAQGLGTVNSMTAAVYIHGYTADGVAEKMSKSGMLPSDVVSELAYSMRAFEK